MEPAASASSSSQGGTRSKKQQELETAPAAEVWFVDMSDEYRSVALEAARLAFLAKERGDLHDWSGVSETIKKEMDDKTGSTWHCLAGTHFGSFVSHEARHVVFFGVGAMKVLLFKHG